MGNKNIPLYEVKVGEVAKVIKKIKFEGEEWYLLKDMKGREFYSLIEFWDIIYDIQSE